MTLLHAGGTLIGDVLDLSSPPADGCLVHPGVCDALDQLKATHAALPELLTQVRGLPWHAAFAQRSILHRPATLVQG